MKYDFELVLEHESGLSKILHKIEKGSRSEERRVGKECKA